MAALPPDTIQTAVYLDGRSNRKRTVTLRFSDTLKISGDDVAESWPYDQVRRADGLPGTLRVSCTGAMPLARLEVPVGRTADMIVANCKSLDVGDAASRQTGRIVAWSLAAVCSILGLTYFGIPYAADRLAPLVPFALEQRMGQAVEKQARIMFGGDACVAPAGQAAFQKMIDKVKVAGGLETPLVAHVVSSKVPNAYALPGGRVYLLDALLQKAKSADEVAGVMAHELGHVYHRHTMRRIIQTGGTSFLVGLLFGDVTGGSAMIFVGKSIFDASYSRDSEREADAFAFNAMRKLGRSPKPMAEFLLRVTGTQSVKTTSILSTHPVTEDRLAAANKIDGPATGEPILTAAEWTALKNICKTK